MPSNQWGPYTPATDGGTAPVYPPTATPAPTGQLDPPQSPSGSVTNESAAFNYANDITSTEEFLTNVIEVDSAQQGTNAISNVAMITASFAGVQPSNIAVFNFAAGVVGTTGNKFS